MATQRLCGMDSDETTLAVADGDKTLFVDTNLDTRLVLIVSDSDTVSVVKEKVMLEHLSCFPEIGEIKILSMKVKRKRNFYHLSSSMRIKNAFESTMKNWFVSVDALSLKQPTGILESCNANTSSQPPLLCNMNHPSTNEHSADRVSKGLAVHDSPLLQLIKAACENKTDSITDQSILMGSFHDVLRDIEIKDKCTFDDQCKNVPSDVNGWSVCKTKEKYAVKDRENQFLGNIAQHNEGGQYITSEKDILGSRPLEKKRHKIHNVDEAFNHTIVEEALNSDSVKNTMSDGIKETGLEENPVIASNNESLEPAAVTAQISAEQNQENKLSNSGILMEPIDNHRVRSVKKIKKKKKVKQSSSLSQDETGTMVPCLQYYGEKGSVEMAHNNELPDAAIVPSSDVNNQTLLEPKEISWKEKQNGTMQKMDEEENISSSREGSERQRLHARDVKRKRDPSDTLEKASKVEVKRTKTLKKRHCDKTNECHSPNTPDLDKDASLFAQKINVSKHKSFGFNDNDEISEAVGRPLSNYAKMMIPESNKPLDCIEGDAKMKEVSPSVNFIGALESGIPGDAKRKTRVKGSARNQGLSDMKLTNNGLGQVSSITDALDNDHLSVETTNDEISAPLVNTELSDRIDKQKELSLNHDPEVVPSKRLETVNYGETGFNTEEPIVSAIYQASNHSGDGRRVKKRAKKSAHRNKHPIVEHAKDSAIGASVALLSAAPEDRKKEEGISYSEKKVTGQYKSEGADREDDDVDRNEAEPFKLDLEGKTCEIPKATIENVRKKGKRIRSSVKKNVPGHPIEAIGIVEEALLLNQVNETLENVQDLNNFKKKEKKHENSAANWSIISVEEKQTADVSLAASNDVIREVDSLSKATNIEKNNEKPDSFGPQSADQSLVLPLHVSNDSCKQMPVEGSEPDNQFEGSKFEGNDINFKHYFVPDQYPKEVYPDDAVRKTRRSRKDSKAVKKAKKIVVPEGDTSPAVEKSLKLHEDSGREEPHHESSNTVHTQMSSKDHQSRKKSIKDSESRVKTLSSDCIPQKDIPSDSTENIRSGPTNSKLDSESSAQSSSSTSSSSKSSNGRLQKNEKHKSSLDRYRVAIREPFHKNKGEGANSLQQDMSLLTSPATILRDGSNGNFSRKDDTENSDASTCPPSDELSLPGPLEEGGRSNMDSPTNAPSSGEVKEDTRKVKRSLQNRTTGSKNVTMGMILRSSSRFKKAKLTASESQLEDTESQPVEFVPDSQTNF